MTTIRRSTICKDLIGYDDNGRGIGCNKPRCEEAGRRSLCREHWEKLQKRQRQLRWNSFTGFFGADRWRARAARAMGGAYEITRHANADGERFTIMYEPRQPGRGNFRSRNRRWLEQSGNTLAEAQALAQADNDARLTDFLMKG